jgi:hypothetical protein
MEISMSVEWLERIERKIDAQGRLLESQTTTLESHGRLLESQGTTLESHGRMLEKHGRMLESHGQMLESHGQMLEKHGRMLESQSKTLDAHGTLLEQHGRELVRLAVALEGVQDDLRGVAEGVIGLGERMDRGFADVLGRLDDRAAPIEAASRHFASKLAEHERRLPKRPRRRRR